MIKIINVNKRFDDKEIFENLNLTIKKGEFIIFSGVSGCGKTTLLNMIGSLEKIDSGEILVDGLDIGKRKNQQKYLSQKIGFLFQNFALVEDKTVLYNLKLIKKANRSALSIDDALKKVELLWAKNKKVYTLSGGEQQRIALARLMIKKCEIILCDEPTGSLDKANSQNVMRILKEMNEAGKTVILVTHDDSVKAAGGRIIDL